MTEKDEKYKGILRLPHFLRKFAMTEGWIPAFAGMTWRERELQKGNGNDIKE